MQFAMILSGADAPIPAPRVAAIRSATGVIDIKLENVWLRANSIPLANGFKLIDACTLVIISATPFAGYAVEEDTVGETWADKITYTVV